MDASGVETVSGILRLTSIIRRILADCDDDVHLYFQEFNGERLRPTMEVLQLL